MALNQIAKKITFEGNTYNAGNKDRLAAALVTQEPNTFEGANTFSGENTFSGGAKGDRVLGSAHADAAVLTEAESGEIFLESTNGATVTLPATVSGYIYTFIWAGSATHTFNISPNASDKIMGIVTLCNSF